jgi:DnaJ like chaperone protein
MAWSSIADTAGAGRLSRFSAALRRTIARLMGLLPRRRHGVDSPAFMTSFVALAAKMAVADGVAVAAEAEAFEMFVDATCSETQAMRRVYDLAKQQTAGYEHYARRIGYILRDEPETRRAVLECLMYVACADGILHPKEDEFLHVVAGAFSIPERDFKRIRCQFVRDFECPYLVLGVAAGAPMTEVKARYRKLVQELHPDKLMGRGAPLAAQKAAAAKLAQINTAYEQIQKELAAA